MNPATSKASDNKRPAPSLEQQRAANAWECVKNGVDKEYVNAAKAMPQLIMNSGLMQTLAFMEQKGGQHAAVAAQLRTWMSERFNGVGRDPGFETLMRALLGADAEKFRLLTAEAFAWLKWLRQFAAAQEKKQ